jgi:sugar/nucleoside kinase (ribokinase family)
VVASTTVPRRLVLVGSVVVDVKVRVPALPERGGDVLAGGLSISAGGGYFVLQAARAGGLPALYAGRHGAGRFGEIVRTALAELDVEAAFPAENAGDTGPCIVLVEPDGERTMITSNGVEAELPHNMLQQLGIRPDDAVYVSGYDLAYPVTGPAVAGWIDELPGDPLVVVDPGPLVADLPEEICAAVLRRTDVLTLSLGEARIMAATTDPVRVAEALLPMLAPDSVIILRNGRHGAFVLRAGTSPQETAAVPVDVSDTTGAGDLHTGAVMAARGSGRPWLTAVQVANDRTAAALATRERG